VAGHVPAGLSHCCRHHADGDAALAPAHEQRGTTPGWLEALTKCGETLEAVQKGLQDYLEAKRVAFPR
jgi:hypothetical protein